jgi:predicted amidohydrolase
VTLTGYLYEQADLDRWAEPLSGPTVRRFSGLARRFGIYLCAGLLEKTAAGVYNAALLFGPSGNVLLRHRKREEHPPFSVGQKATAWKLPLDGWVF